MCWKAGYTATVGWLLGRTPAVGESYDLSARVGRRYLITVGPKLNKAGQPTVLVVDDDESLQNLFKLFLKKIGFSRVVVGTVREALAALDKQKFDLIFLDLKLPDGPADDVYDQAKKEQPECPIIVITGYPDSEMLDRILAKGPITVLKKPLKVEQLKETVRILGHKEAVKLAA